MGRDRIPIPPDPNQGPILHPFLSPCERPCAMLAVVSAWVPLRMSRRFMTSKKIKYFLLGPVLPAPQTEGLIHSS